MGTPKAIPPGRQDGGDRKALECLPKILEREAQRDFHGQSGHGPPRGGHAPAGEAEVGTANPADAAGGKAKNCQFPAHPKQKKAHLMQVGLFCYIWRGLDLVYVDLHLVAALAGADDAVDDGLVVDDLAGGGWGRAGPAPPRR